MQASLLLLPVAALAVPGWRDHLLWGAAEVVYATGTWLYLYGLSVRDRGLPASGYAVLLLVRLVAWWWLASRAVALTGARRPTRSGCRSTRPGCGRDDPAGGALAGRAGGRGPEG